MNMEVKAIKLFIDFHVTGDMDNVWETIYILNDVYKLGFDLPKILAQQHCSTSLIQSWFDVLGPSRSKKIAFKILSDYHLVIADDMSSPYLVPVVETYCLAHQFEPPRSMWGYLIRYRQMVETISNKHRKLKRTFLKLCC